MIPEAAIAVAVVALAAWDGWRRWLARGAAIDREALGRVPDLAARLAAAEQELEAHRMALGLRR